MLERPFGREEWREWCTRAYIHRYNWSSRKGENMRRGRRRARVVEGRSEREGGEERTKRKRKRE